MSSKAPSVHGIDLDGQTRCAHYHGPSDVIAIKMKCCSLYYACKDCHDALADHPIKVWLKTEQKQKAILCGACGAELTIEQYMAGNFHCAACDVQFNPGCKNHYHYYFES